MKLIFRRLISCIIVLGMISGGIVWLGYVVRPLDTDGAYSQVESFHDLPENSVEVIIYGSSHAYRGVNPMELYESYGIGAYNYAWHWQRINTSTLFLRDSLLTQKPKVVLMEAFLCNNVHENVTLGPEIYYSRYIHDKTAKKEYLQQCFGDNISEYLSYYFPLIPFHDNWSDLTYSSFKPLENNQDCLMALGFSGTTKTEEHAIPDPATFRQRELRANSIVELEKIISICKENDMELIFFTVPYAQEYFYGNAMEEFCRTRDCEFLNLFDYLDEMEFDGTTDLSDATHLNTSGATKVAAFLGNYLVSNYSFTDMRTVEGNIWQKALESR